MNKENEKDQKPVIARVEISGIGYKKAIPEVKDIVLIKDKEQLDKWEKLSKNSTILAIGTGDISEKLMKVIIYEEKVNGNHIKVDI